MPVLAFGTREVDDLGTEKGIVERLYVAPPI
jgi:hypothetical protein